MTVSAVVGTLAVPFPWHTDMTASPGPGLFGVLLQKYRVAAGLSQDELAERAGLSRRGISDLERGERRFPHLGTARRLAEALGLSETQRASLLASIERTSPDSQSRAVDRDREHGARGDDSLPARPIDLIGDGRETPDIEGEPARAPLPTSTESRGEQTYLSTETTCATCGANAGPAAQYCGQCGAALRARCAACGADISSTDAFCGGCGTRVAAAMPGQAPASAVIVDERRRVSVVFAELASYIALGEQLDPEEVKELAQLFVGHFSAIVARFGGSVIREAGDEVLAVFGAPIAHEDDPERAVRAALAMRNTAPTAPSGARVQMHIGICTGEVMTGPVGGSQHGAYSVYGGTLNTAARLRSAAGPGTVLVGEETYLATRRVVRYIGAPPVPPKGNERPVPAWEALEASAVQEGRRLGTAPFIGRDHELALLTDLWAKVVRDAEPHLVTILGEPGIGKSRLVSEFENRRLSDARALHGRCLPYGEVLGYWALATVLKEAAGITPEDQAALARARLEALVEELLVREGAGGDVAGLAGHLALLSGLEVATDHGAVNPIDQHTLHAAVRRFLEALAREHPLCLLLEDIQWADDAMLDMLEFVASRAVGVPLLIVIQARPELLDKRPAWGRSVRGFTSLPLEPLAPGDAAELVLALCREHGLDPSVAEAVGLGAGGNPLFAEELVATVAEQGGAIGGVPARLRSLISARLDLLPRAEREAVQLAAVCGKVFWVSALSALGASGDLNGQLEALEHRTLVRAQMPSQFRGDRQYTFKHDLIRDVAYEILPRVVRRPLHSRVADWIEQASGERVEEYLDVLAHHALQANQPGRALDYLRRAAQRAARTAAHRQQAALLGQAVPLAEQLGQTALVAELLASRGRAFANCGLWIDARSQMEAALAALGSDGAAERARVLVDLSEACFWSRDVAGLRRSAREAQILATSVGRDDVAAEATAWLAESAKVDGELVTARELYLRAIAQAGGVHCRPLALAALTLYLMGKIDEAVEIGRQAVDMVRQVTHGGVGDTLATMYALPHLGLALAAGGRYTEALAVFEDARRFGREYEVGHFLARSIAMSAGFHLDVYDYVGAEALSLEALDLARSVNFPLTIVSAGIDLLMNYARSQEVGRAEAMVDDVARQAETVGGWHGWLWQIRLDEARAEIALAHGQWEEAFRRSSSAIDASRARSRVKYQVLGLTSRAQAAVRLGREQDAAVDLRSAVALARPVGDPALFLRAAGLSLALDGDEPLWIEANAAVLRIAAALPAALRPGFETYQAPWRREPRSSA